MNMFKPNNGEVKYFATLCDYTYCLYLYVFQLTVQQ